jgi:hypothetical protein
MSSLIELFVTGSRPELLLTVGNQLSDPISGSHIEIARVQRTADKPLHSIGLQASTYITEAYY